MEIDDYGDLGFGCKFVILVKNKGLNCKKVGNCGNLFVIRVIVLKKLRDFMNFL